MGKGARNRRIRRESVEIAANYGSLGNPKPLARLYRRLVVQHRRRKHPSKPKGPRVWRTPEERGVKK